MRYKTRVIVEEGEGDAN